MPADPRVFSSTLLGVALTLGIVGLATTHWRGGNLFNSKYSDQSTSDGTNTALACAGLLVTGILLWLIAFVIGLVQFCSSENWIGQRGLGFFYLASLYVGTGLNLLAIILYTNNIAKDWSYLLCATAWTASMIVSFMAISMCRCNVRRP